MSTAEPLPVYAAETHMGRLSTAEAVVVSTFRLWFAPHCYPLESHPSWKTGLQVAGMAPWGLHAFDTLLWITMAAGTLELDVRCQHCSQLGHDEAWLLQMVNRAQVGLHVEAEAILRSWMTPAGARAGLRHLDLFSHALANVDLLVGLSSSSVKLVPSRRPDRLKRAGAPTVLH